jgi:predicted dinucleotide-binding enzyme
MSRILIVGGYGTFGARVAERLARESNIEIVIAGRSDDKAAQYAELLAARAKARVSHARLDASRASRDQLAALSPTVTINASGPFQDQGYALARACIDARSHYVDLADARAFVTGISQLDDAARAANVCVVSGASSVPGLSSAVVTSYAGKFAHLDELEIGISPGNSFDPGVATGASILAQAGKPHSYLKAGRVETAYGWQGLHRYRFPGLGARWMSDVDVPDLELMPLHFASLQSVRFRAGVEVGLFHIGLWSLSWLVRAGLIRDLGSLAAPLLRAKRTLRFLGSDRGGMYVTLRGRANGTARELHWHLIAGSGDGPYVPGIASVILAKRLVANSGPAPGARPCFALFTVADFEAEVADLDIACQAEWVPAASR